LVELESREPIFHRREFGTTRAEFGRMLDPGFLEVGASGRIYDREHVLDVLEQRMQAEDPEPDNWRTRDFHCHAIAPELYLLMYTLMQGERVTRRTTLWRRTPGGWQAVFHQGTVADLKEPV